MPDEKGGHDHDVSSCTTCARRPGPRRPRPGSGRGEGGKGKTAGRGTKGTKARGQVPAGFEGGQMPLHMRLPKLKGFTNPIRVEYQVVNLDRIAALFPDGGEVTAESLADAGRGPPQAIRSRCSVRVTWTVAVQVQRARVLGLGADQDRGRRRHRHRAVTAAVDVRGDRRRSGYGGRRVPTC